MRLKIYLKGIFLVIFAVFFNVIPALAVDTAEENSIVKEEQFDQRRRRKPRRRSRRRKSRRRRTKRSRRRTHRRGRSRRSRHRSRRRVHHKKPVVVDEALQRAKEKVARETLLSGGYAPLKQDIPQAKVAILPLINRFRDFDKTLNAEEISYIFYNYKAVKQPQDLRDKQIKALNRAIQLRGFRKALGIAKELLKFEPLDLTLISKASQLAHHVRDKSYLGYTWQITELLYTISKSGDGKSVQKPYKLHSLLDIICFEELWLETDKKDILELKIVPESEGNVVKLFYKDKEGKKQIRYYRLV